MDERFKNDKSGSMKFQEPNALHGIVAQKLNEQIDEIAVDRELEMEDEDALVHRKKQELKQWFVTCYKHEVSQKLSQSQQT